MDTRGMPERTAVVKKVERVYDGFIAVEKALVSHPRYDGGRQTITRLSVERGDSVAVILVDLAKRTIWLTEQFRYPTLSKASGWIREIPAGTVDVGESMDDAARREVMEETGFIVDTMELVGTFFLSPGGTSERIVLYYATVKAGERQPELANPEEDIELVEEHLASFLEAARLGRIDDAKTLVAGLWLIANARRLGL